MNAVHGWGGRVIAVGTTVVRALETVARPRRTTSAPARALTNLVVTPERGLHAVDGLHHRLARAELVTPADCSRRRRARTLLERSYAAAEARGYRFHEFGDSHLILP